MAVEAGGYPTVLDAAGRPRSPCPPKVAARHPARARADEAATPPSGGCASASSAATPGGTSTSATSSNFTADRHHRRRRRQAAAQDPQHLQLHPPDRRGQGLLRDAADPALRGRPGHHRPRGRRRRQAVREGLHLRLRQVADAQDRDRRRQDRDRARRRVLHDALLGAERRPLHRGRRRIHRPGRRPAARPERQRGLLGGRRGVRDQPVVGGRTRAPDRRGPPDCPATSAASSPPDASTSDIPNDRQPSDNMVDGHRVLRAAVPEVPARALVHDRRRQG